MAKPGPIARSVSVLAPSKAAREPTSPRQRRLGGPLGELAKVLLTRANLLSSLFPERCGEREEEGCLAMQAPRGSHSSAVWGGGGGEGVLGNLLDMVATSKLGPAGAHSIHSVNSACLLLRH